RTMLEVYQSKDPQAERKRIVDSYKAMLPQFYRNSQMNEDDGERMMARAAGVLRMMNSYARAARISDRLAAVEARKARDAAVADYVFIPANLFADQVPDPTPAVLQAHFDKYKTVKPGEGEYGIGYLFPARVRIEWLKLDRSLFEKGVTLDPVEVVTRYRQ